MKYIKNFRMFEAVIMPQKIDSDSIVNSFESLVSYGEENGFDVVDYNGFYNSLPEADKKTAPPKHIPFFALFHPVNKRPMFVLVEPNIIRIIPNFKEVVDDIIGHERIHGEQSRRKGDVEYSLPSPTDKKAYFSNKEEIMAFSWTIANGLSKRKRDLESAMKSLDEPVVIHMMPEQHKMLWLDIRMYCDEKTIKRYRKYIYLYLENIFNEKSPVN
jgi:hypothetical protein